MLFIVGGADGWGDIGWLIMLGQSLVYIYIYIYIYNIFGGLKYV